MFKIVTFKSYNDIFNGLWIFLWHCVQELYTFNLHYLSFRPNRWSLTKLDTSHAGWCLKIVRKIQLETLMFIVHWSILDHCLRMWRKTTKWLTCCMFSIYRPSETIGSLFKQLVHSSSNIAVVFIFNTPFLMCQNKKSQMFKQEFSH